MQLVSVKSWEVGEWVVALWKDHTSKPSTNVLMPPKLGALREVACGNTMTPGTELWKMDAMHSHKIPTIQQG